MSNQFSEADSHGHDHVFLGAGHEQNERKARAVIILCTIVMIVEIAGGSIYGSLALIADGLHMSTHAAAMLIATLAYTYARRHANDPRFAFGTGKFGDLAGFSSAIILAMIALLIGYEAVSRLIQPIPIDFNQAIPIGFLGLLVNIVSAWLLSGGDHGHHHGHHHDHSDHEHDDDHAHDDDHHHDDNDHAPHEATHRDHNLRAAFVHVVADAAVSVLAILGLAAGKWLGWTFMDPVMGIIGALVIANWSYGLIRDTGGILLDMTADPRVAEAVRYSIEVEGDRVTDLHLWRLGPGHLGAIIAIHTDSPRETAFYRDRLKHLEHLSHVTIEVFARSGPRPTGPTFNGLA